MKKQKIRGYELYPSALKGTNFCAISAENFRNSVERFLHENYEGAFRLTTAGVFNGFVRLIPENAASFLTSMFRIVCLRSVLDISIIGEYGSITLTASFPKSLEFDQEAGIEWVYLSESSGFEVHTGCTADSNVMCVKTRVYSFMPELRAISSFADFYLALTASENFAHLVPPDDTEQGR